MKVSVRVGEVSRYLGQQSHKFHRFCGNEIEDVDRKVLYGCGQLRTYTVVFQDGSSMAKCRLIPPRRH